MMVARLIGRSIEWLTFRRCRRDGHLMGGKPYCLDCMHWWSDMGDDAQNRYLEYQREYGRTGRTKRVKLRLDTGKG